MKQKEVNKSVKNKQNGVQIKYLIIILISVIIIAGILAFVYFKFFYNHSDTAEERDMKITTISENVVVSLNDGNYNSFIKDFSPEMKKELNKSNFLELRDLINNTSGEYVVKLYSGKTTKDGYEVYYYDCVFKKEGSVSLVISFRINSYLVEGLWFDSTNIRNYIATKA